MFGYTMDEVGNIMVMQGFSGLSLFSVLLLMALGLAIIFGKMGVINMAHGEFMTVGAYTTVFMSKLAVKYEIVNSYFVFAIIAAFILAFFIGYFIEYLLIRHLYKRPLDTLLATWGLSLVMQQIFRSTFGAKEVSAELPEWLLGSFKPTADIDIPINGVFVMGLALIVTVGVYFFMFRSRGGLRVRATMQNRIMAGAIGINTQKVDRLTFALGCGIAGVAGAAFTTISSTSPTTGSLYIVDSFMVVVFGGSRKSDGNHCFSLWYRSGAIHFAILYDQFHGQGCYLNDDCHYFNDASRGFVCI